MRDDQARRYARHIQLPDIGGLGQTALMVACAHVPLREREPDAELVAASYLAAGGVGTIAVANANAQQLAELSAHGPDSRIVDHADAGREVTLAQRPAWWPGAAGDDVALAFWRGGIAAATWMIDVASR